MADKSVDVDESSNHDISNIEEIDKEQQLALNVIKQWIITEAEFVGRTDDDFIMVFLLGCKFDISKTKEKMTKYYNNRIKYPNWLANLNPKDPEVLSILKMNWATYIKSEEKGQPSIMILTSSRVPNNCDMFDNLMKTFAIYGHIFMHEKGIRYNGLHVIVNGKNRPVRLIKRILSPSFIRMAGDLNGALPVKLKSVNFVNASPVAVVFYKLLKPFIPRKMQKRYYFYGSDWSLMMNHVPVELLPEELKGFNGPMSRYDDETLQRILSLSEFINEDNQYGQKRERLN
ncbi:hypothetical protein CHUAL_002831 [Chamberlinius hualienensis]